MQDVILKKLQDYQKSYNELIEKIKQIELEREKLYQEALILYGKIVELQDLLNSNKTN